MLNEEALRTLLPRSGFGLPLYYRSSLGSTQVLAAERAQAGDPEGTLVLAEEQTAGRGRFGRSWQAAPGASLTFSLILRPSLPAAEAQAWLNSISLASALAVAEAVDPFGPGAEVKWPNDVLIGGRKVAGVLFEPAWEGDHLAYCIAGIGVNVGPLALPRGEPLDFPATCLEVALGCPVPVLDLLTGILDALAVRYPPAEPSAVFQAVEGRLAYLGEWVEVEATGQRWKGCIIGLDPAGCLNLKLAGAERVRIDIPEGHLRPVDTPKG
jgi:BirA family biotin operon repressor/biotin-[acetyl-CoA-carboxylase] ligase